MYNIYSDTAHNTMTPTTDVAQWVNNYKEQNLEVSHDQSMATLGTPDECLVIAGPTRLASEQASRINAFPVIGMASMIQYTESAQIQPMKAIGSRRHVFSKTNLPVQGSIGRLVIAGRNTFRSLYQGINTKTPLGLDARNAKLASNGWDSAGTEKSSWFHNLEEDLFRVPFGIGFVFSCPGALANKGVASNDSFIGGEYLECCVLQSRTVSIQTGQTLIMEQVQFMADRLIPWTSFSGADLDIGAAYELKDIFPFGSAD